MIPYGRQDIADADIAAVVEVLRSDFLTQGPQVPRFEGAVAAYCGAGNAVAVNSATSALHVACLALDLGPGDKLWTSPITFVASANCARYCGANVDFVDIDPDTYNMCPKALAAKLEVAATTGNLPKIVVPVHMCGQSCDMPAISALAGRYGFRIIEDASHAIGGMFAGDRIGACRYSDITVFSFHPVKIVTTAEGGMAMTNDEQLARRMDLLRSHGITRDPERMTRSPEGAWCYEQVVLGFNYRMTDLQAALGLSQLGRIEQYLQRRHQIAQRYDELLLGLPLRTPWQDPRARSAFHLYAPRLELKGTHRNRTQVFTAMRNGGVGVNVHYIPVHTQPYFRALGFNAGDYPVAESYYADAISLPMFPTLTDGQQFEVVNQLTLALGV